jgi:hypothetical protein|uniref:Uncharacterized protein n=1 Tax=viral metagenome TaxID=1070528 RepID=A0A6C0GZW2_9ZZZZ
MDKESINQSFLLIEDPNLLVILNDPDVGMNLKNLIIKIDTDKLFTSKLSNSVQKDDFKLETKKTYKKNKRDLLNQLNILIDTTIIRKKDAKRFQKYLKYINKYY